MSACNIMTLAGACLLRDLPLRANLACKSLCIALVTTPSIHHSNPQELAKVYPNTAFHNPSYRRVSRVTDRVQACISGETVKQRAYLQHALSYAISLISADPCMNCCEAGIGHAHCRYAIGCSLALRQQNCESSMLTHAKFFDSGT